MAPQPFGRDDSLLHGGLPPGAAFLAVSILPLTYHNSFMLTTRVDELRSEARQE